MLFSGIFMIFQRNKLIFFGFIAILVCLIAGLILGIISLDKVHNLPPENRISTDLTGKILFFFLSGLFLSGLFAWAMKKYSITISEDVVTRIYEITEIDTKSLSNTLSQLAQGDIATHIELSIPDQPQSGPGADHYTQILSRLMQELQNCVVELNNLTDMPCHRLCYIGADSYLEGRRCGQAMGELLEGEGEIIIFVGNFTATHFELRRKGFENTLRTKFPRMNVVQLYATHEDPEKTYQRTLEALDKYPRLRGIYLTEGATPHGAARAVRERNASDKIKIVCHDLTDDTMDNISKGFIQATLDQNPYAQGYNPVILLYNYLIGEWKPFTPRMLTKMDIVTPDNYLQYWHPVHGIIQSKESLGRLVRPSEKISEKPLRIAVFCLANSAFWLPVEAAVRNAGEQLSSKNTTVDWITPGEFSGDEGDQFKKCLVSLIDQHYDGIATILPSRNMVPAINKAITNGIPVITFNSEPVSLQGLIRAITDQADKLINFSAILGDNADAANSLTQKITDAMNHVSEGSIVQNNQVNQTQIILNSLLNNINQVNQATEEGSKATANTAIAITDGAKAMEKTMVMVKNVELAVTDAWHKVEDLGKHSEKIDSVIDLIQDITSRVNVLALNASIEATQAGNEGQGFMVVATEVRRLSGSAGKATQEVTHLINQVKRDIDKIEMVMSSGLDQVKQSAKQTTEAQLALQNIKKMVEMDQSRLKNIADAVAEIQTYSYRVEEAMDNVTEISERNTHSVQNVHETTKDMISQLTQVTALASTLEMMAQSELELLSRFNVSTHAHAMNEEDSSS